MLSLIKYYPLTISQLNNMKIILLLGIIAFWGEQIFQLNHLLCQVSDKKANRFI